MTLSRSIGQTFPGHVVRWVHKDSDVRGEIVCLNPPSASCFECDDQCAHADGVQHAQCLVVEDMLAVVEIGFLYIGKSSGVRSGLVEIAWDGADYVWWYFGDDHAELSDPDDTDTP